MFGTIFFLVWLWSCLSTYCEKVFRVINFMYHHSLFGFTEITFIVYRLNFKMLENLATVRVCLNEFRRKFSFDASLVFNKSLTGK
jgi:ABC-type transport system involved in cytochrome c biogenesis permease subunit